MAKLYSEEQVQRAKGVDLEQYLSSRGEKLKRTGGESVWIYCDASGTHDSVTVRGNKWFDHKRQQGGDSIGFLQEFMGYSFPSAVESLLGGEQGIEKPNFQNRTVKRGSVEGIKTQVNPFFVAKEPQSQRQPFILPAANTDMQKLFAYLVKTRLISPDIVQHFVDDKSLYQEKSYGNIVFLCRDVEGTAVSGSKKSTNSYAQNSYKGTLAGSNTEYGFGHNGTSKKLFIFEAPIDLMSYLTIHPNQWQEHSYRSLDGLSPKVMLKFIDDHPYVNEVNICLDHDEAGIEAADKFRDLLIEKGIDPNKINRLTPVHKDWNEMLKAKAGLPYKPAVPHPQIEALKNHVMDLCDASNREARHGNWRNFQFAEEGIPTIATALQKEYALFKNSVDTGKTAKLTSPNAHAHLLHMTDICFHSLIEMEASKNPNINPIQRYRELASSIYADYKPYMDKGKLRNRCADLDKSLEILMKILQSTEKKVQMPSRLLDFAKHCLFAKVYLDIKYEADLEMQESFVQATQQSKEDLQNDSEPTLSM